MFHVSRETGFDQDSPTSTADVSPTTSTTASASTEALGAHEPSPDQVQPLYFDGADEAPLEEVPDAPIPRPEGWGRAYAFRDGARRRLAVDWPIFLLVAAFVLYFSATSIKVLDGRGYPSFDLAIFDQGIWLLSHFHNPFVTIIGRPLFGDHAQFILIPVALIYRLFPEPDGLLVMQWAFIGATAIPIYYTAKKLIKSRAMATLLGAAFLLNPITQQVNVMQVHTEFLLVFFVVCAIWAAIESRYGWLLAMVILALLVKEDAASMIIPLGVWVFFRRDRKWGIRIAVIALAFALIDNLVLIPAFLGAPTIYTDRIPFGGVGGLLKTTFRQPGQVVSYLRSGGRPFYVWQIAFMGGLGFLLAPEIAGIALLVIIENVMSSNIYMHTSTFWYSLPLEGILAMGCVWAVSRQKSLRRARVVTGVVFLCALWSCYLWGYAPFSHDKIFEGISTDSASYKAMTYVEEPIPPNASVAAYYFPWNTALDHRVQIYSWTNPFLNNAYGLPSQSGERMPAADDVQYLVLPYPLTSPVDISTFKSISSDYHVVRSRGGWRLYEKNAS
jgi:uncharacterized membrane protein